MSGGSASFSLATNGSLLSNPSGVGFGRITVELAGPAAGIPTEWVVSAGSISFNERLNFDANPVTGYIRGSGGAPTLTLPYNGTWNNNNNNASSGFSFDPATSLSFQKRSSANLGGAFRISALVVPESTSTCGPGVAKEMSVVSGQGPWDVDIDFNVENFANEPLTNLTMVDDLEAVFGTEGVDWEFDSLTQTSGPATFTVNPTFDGQAAGDTELIAAGSELGPLESASLTASITLFSPGTYTNSTTLSGDIAGVTFSDDSVDGTDPDANGNDDPTDDTSPTTISLAGVDVAKTVGDPVIATSGTEGNVDIEFTVTVTNEGDDPVDDISLTDDLDDQFGGAFVDVITAPVVSGDLAAARANAGFDGNADVDLLTVNATEALDADESFTVTFTAEFDPDADVAALPLENVATATVTPPTGGPLVTPNPPVEVPVPQLEDEKVIVSSEPSAATPGATDVTYACLLYTSPSPRD